MSIGIQLFNDKEELFYDSDYADSVMSLTERREFTISGAMRDMDLGVPQSNTCIVFFKTGNNACYGIQQAKNGRWVFSAFTNVTTHIVLYIFSTLPQSNPAPKQYGVQLYNSAGNVIIHNNSKPLVCEALPMNRDTGITNFGYQPACTGAYLGAVSMGAVEQLRLIFSTAVGNQVLPHTHVIFGSAPRLGNYHISVLVINSQLYD